MHTPSRGGLLLLATALCGCDNGDDKKIADAKAQVEAELRRRAVAAATPEAAPEQPSAARPAADGLERMPADDQTGAIEVGVAKPAPAKLKDEAKAVYSEISDLLAIGTGELSRLRKKLEDPNDRVAAQRCGALMHGSGVGDEGTIKRAKAVRERADVLPSDEYFDLKIAAVDAQFCITCASDADEACERAKADLRSAKKSLR